jgi:hypothetical protein
MPQQDVMALLPPPCLLSVIQSSAAPQTGMHVRAILPQRPQFLLPGMPFLSHPWTPPDRLATVPSTPLPGGPASITVLTAL